MTGGVLVGPATESFSPETRLWLRFALVCRKQAVAQAEAALNDAWTAEVGRVQEQADSRVAELEAQVLRLMTQMEDARREDASTVGLHRWKAGGPAVNALRSLPVVTVSFATILGTIDSVCGCASCPKMDALRRPLLPAEPRFIRCCHSPCQRSWRR